MKKGSLGCLLLFLLLAFGQNRPAAAQAVSGCKVTYYKDQAASACYKKLTRKVEQGERIRLPELPSEKGQEPLGWTTSESGDTPLYKAGSTVTIKKNTKFYAVQSRIKYYTLDFRLGSGASNKTYRALKIVK